MKQIYFFKIGAGSLTWQLCLHYLLPVRRIFFTPEYTLKILHEGIPPIRGVKCSLFLTLKVSKKIIIIVIYSKLHFYIRPILLAVGRIFFTQEYTDNMNAWRNASKWVRVVKFNYFLHQWSVEMTTGAITSHLYRLGVELGRDGLHISHTKTDMLMVCNRKCWWVARGVGGHLSVLGMWGGLGGRIGRYLHFPLHELHVELAGMIYKYLKGKLIWWQIVILVGSVDGVERQRWAPVSPGCVWGGEVWDRGAVKPFFYGLTRRCVITSHLHPCHR